MTFGTSGKNLSRAILLLAVLGLSLFFTVYSEATYESAMRGLSMCATAVVPSLFPFMVLSAVASKAASHLTGNRSVKTAVILSAALGALCGFPVGAASVASMYKNGTISKNKAENMCAFCNNTGPAFVIGVIGRSFWRSTKIGVMFYISQLLSAAIVFFIWHLIKSRREMEKTEIPKQYYVNNLSGNNQKNSLDSFCKAFCNSVAESAVAVVQICGYIVFFRVICDSLKILLPMQNEGKLLYLLLSTVLEFTSGSNAAASIGGGVGIALCGFAIGFSGLSVMAQSAGLLSSAGLSAGPLFRMKIIIGSVCGAISSLLYKCFHFSEAAFVETDISCYHPNSVAAVLILAVAAIAYVIIFIKRLLNRRNHY